MRLLIDTQLLLWSQVWQQRLTPRMKAIILDQANELVFSTISLAEIAIKSALRRPEFAVDAREMRRALLTNDYHELPLDGEHACRVGDLPPIHRDPFDRLLIAQALATGMQLLTADAALAAYGPSVRLVT